MEEPTYIPTLSPLNEALSQTQSQSANSFTAASDGDGDDDEKTIVKAIFGTILLIGILASLALVDLLFFSRWRDMDGDDHTKDGGVSEAGGGGGGGASGKSQESGSVYSNYPPSSLGLSRSDMKEEDSEGLTGTEGGLQQELPKTFFDY